MFNHSRRNLARWFAGSMGSILVVFAVGVFHLETEDQMRSFDQTLLNKSQTIASAIRYRLHQGQWQTDLNEVPILGGESLPIDSEVAYVRWYDSDGRLVKFMGKIPSEQLTVSPGLITLNSPDEPRPRLLRQITLPVLQDEMHLGYLQMAVPLEPVQSSLQQLRLFLAVSVPLALGIIGITGWILGGFAMRPIQQSYEQLQRFTADVSHELRAPLAAILSNVQIGLIKPTTDLDRQQQRLQKLANITQSMGTLVSHLLLLARYDGPLPTELLQPVDLVLLLKSLINRYSTDAFSKELTFQADLPNAPLWLAAEPDLLQQAITNLLSNAIKYTPAGGKVTLRLTQTAHHAIVQVEDTGIGIPTADLPKIFDRFYRIDPVRTPDRRSGQAGGYGLGLSIVQQIVKAHRGQIHAASSVGQGSCFTIKLPLRSIKAAHLKLLG